jgi:hypothetical protein
MSGRAAEPDDDEEIDARHEHRQAGDGDRECNKPSDSSLEPRRDPDRSCNRDRHSCARSDLEQPRRPADEDVQHRRKHDDLGRDCERERDGEHLRTLGSAACMVGVDYERCGEPHERQDEPAEPGGGATVPADNSCSDRRDDGERRDRQASASIDPWPMVPRGAFGR